MGTLCCNTARCSTSISLELWCIDVQSGQKTLKTILTNADGRTDAPLLMDAELTVGVYELVFKVGNFACFFSDPLSDPPFLDHPFPIWDCRSTALSCATTGFTLVV